MTDAPACCFAPDARIAFVSDVHLSDESPEERDRFIAFLDRCGQEQWTALFLHGDLFEFYVGPRQGRGAFYLPLFAALSRLVYSGTQVYVQRGNRDYLLGREFERAGVIVLRDHVMIRLGTLRAHLSHGDDLCIEDRSYQFWAKGVLQSAPLKMVTRVLPLGIALALARRYRRHSAKKWLGLIPQSRLPTIFKGARVRVSALPADFVIAGHVHELALTQLDAGGHPFLLATTGSWQEAPNAIVFERGELRIEVLAGLDRRP